MRRTPTPRPVAALTDPDLLLPAQRVMHGALSLAPDERVVICVDAERRRLGEALASAARDRRAIPVVFELEALGARPLPVMPPALRRELEQAQASVLLIGVTRFPEVALRTDWIEVVARVGLRHAHMPGLGRRGFALGFGADAARVASAVSDLRARVRDARRIAVQSLGGTRLEIELSPDFRWKEAAGVIRAGRPENLPGGHLSTHPASVDGTYVADASLLGPAAGPEGLLGARGVRFSLRQGRCVGVECSDAALRALVERHLASEPDLDRVGQVIVGANLGIASPIGEPLFDQSAPGLHLVFGFTLARETGARWSSRGILTACGAYADVSVDDRPVVSRGRVVP